MSRQFQHRPVLLAETITHLDLAAGAVAVDGTLGGGGHAAAILERIGPTGLLIGLDVDANAREAAAARLSEYGERVRIVPSSFRHMDAALASVGVDRADAVLLDLGVSSHQIDTRERGFRFADAETQAAPLDMRMNTADGPTAAQLLARAPVEELERVFREFGEVRGARRLARYIGSVRERAPLRTTGDLVGAVREARIGGGRRHDPATLVFQALRIAVNDELAALTEGLDAAVRVLSPGGRLVVISYHSLEDRIVKHHFRAAQRGCTCPPDLPVCACGGRVTLRVVTRRPVRPSESEIDDNPRARSARLRAAERVREAA